MFQLDSAVIQQAVPMWRRANHAIMNARPMGDSDNRRKNPLPSPDNVLRAHGIRGRTFAELRIYAAHERAIRLAATTSEPEGE